MSENLLLLWYMYFSRDGDVFALRQEIEELRRRLNDQQGKGGSSGRMSGEVCDSISYE